MIYKVIENFAPDDLYNHINEVISKNFFPWYFQTEVATDIENTFDDFYFTHTFFGDGTYNVYGPNSEYFDSMIIPLCRKLIKSDIHLIRAKANLFTRRDTNVKYGVHVDYDYDHTTWVYSVDTNNGYTEFDDGTIIPSVANQLLIFDGKIPHRSVGQTDTKSRININVNLNMKPELLC